MPTQLDPLQTTRLLNAVQALEAALADAPVAQSTQQLAALRQTQQAQAALQHVALAKLDALIAQLENQDVKPNG